jgi:hypothetical protein
METVESPRRESMIDLPFRKAQRQQLPARNYAVLPFHQTPNATVPLYSKIQRALFFRPHRG